MASKNGSETKHIIEYVAMCLRYEKKMNEIAEEAEGCCFAIQQSILPKLPNSKEKDEINKETGRIDELMTKLRTKETA